MKFVGDAQDETMTFEYQILKIGQKRLSIAFKFIIQELFIKIDYLSENRPGILP